MEQNKKMNFFVRLKKSIFNLEQYEDFAIERPTKAIRIFSKINDCFLFININWNYIQILYNG